MTGSPRFYTFPSGLDPLATLAEAVSAGFPLQGEKLPLHRWTIFLPTRRAVRTLSAKFHELNGGATLLLPDVRPIDDIDEDIIQLNSAHDLPPALSAPAQVFLLTAMVKSWAAVEQHHSIAKEISDSHMRAFGLAESLVQLIDQLETENIPFDNLAKAYDFTELAEHREAILSLLAIVRDQYPAELKQRGLMGRAARRNAVIRLQADYVASGRFKGPVVAAGSTGSNPETRALLQSIALHPQGAVILPGLDKSVSEDDWQQLAPTHPQYGLQRLLEALKLSRADVMDLGEGGPRRWLAHEIMRPTTSTQQWKTVVAQGETQIQEALNGVSLVEAHNRHLEARTIALKLRGILEHPKKSAALVTPDRDLAQRVKAELLRWDIVIDDSAGEPLTRFGLPSLMVSMLNCVATGFAAAALLEVLHHPLVTLGWQQTEFQRSARHLELVAFRQQGFDGGLDHVLNALARAELNRAHDTHLHPVIQRLSDDDWRNLRKLAENFVVALRPLATSEVLDLKQCLFAISTVLNALAPSADPEHPAQIALSDCLSKFEEVFSFSEPLPLFDTFAMVMAILRKESLRDPRDVHPRLAILGLAEARMLRPDFVVLGGLNEGKWPQQVDPGPWLNRTMRDNIGLAVPERNVGLTAHDFVEAFTQKEVMLTWSQRDQQQPLVPSRWVLRLRMLMEGVGINFNTRKQSLISHQAILLDKPMERMRPHPKPRARPPVSARPRNFSVTEVVRLNRDPYHVYARRILNLQPIDELGSDADARLRGMLFHEAIGRWNAAQKTALDPETLKLLKLEGENVLAPLKDDVALHLFWSRRFERIALWLADNEPELRRNVTSVHPEARGAYAFDVAGETYHLSCFADRIDILTSGTRIIDYKTSTSATPSNKAVLAGWEPQLTLEAALLSKGAFKEIASAGVTELAYIIVTGSASADKFDAITPDGEPIGSLAGRHFEGLKAKLAIFADENVPYLPRVHMQKENDASDFDHLSRYREWSLAEQS
jgi:ATP-dependent helicase/nuclease subunit B